MARKPLLLPLAACLVLLAVVEALGQQGRPREGEDVSNPFPVITPTSHPPVPSELSGLWLAPERGPSAGRTAPSPQLANAVRLIGNGEYSKALAIVSQPSVEQGTLSRYARYYAGVSQLRLDRPAEALASFRAVQAQKPVGYLSEAAALGEAEALEALSQPAEALPIYDRLLRGRLSDVELVYMRLGGAAKAAGDRARAADAFTHVLYEFPLGANAPAARSELQSLRGHKLHEGGPEYYKLELGRAERLFVSKRYAEARDLFEDLRDVDVSEDEELLRLRVAECDYFTKRSRSARDSLRTLSEGASRQSEALFFYALASRTLGDTVAFVTALHRIASEFPEQTWAEDALDNLATHYIRANDDDSADGVFRELYKRYPRGAYAERAAWKSGWRAYRQGDYQYAARTFEQAASDFPRSDYRPPWLYWSGRAQERLGSISTARERYLIAATDYMNSYYGRLAAGRLRGGSAVPVPVAVSNRQSAGRAPVEPADPTLPANGMIIRTLLDAEMFDDALNELRYAQRVWGDSAAIEATIAWTRQQQSRTQSGMQRFQLLRGSITSMRRAYPQFMAAGGEDLPREVLTVIYPLAYWDLIRKYSEVNGLDPFFVAALVAQESTFVADVRSGANAYGLMQLLPSTARRYAARLKIPYSTRALTNPEANIRIGTAYLADQVRAFGDLHLVLAAYNAGERAVRRWQEERPDIEVEEFIDDIPYPETQNYVKKILGTAEDYRRLYGGADTSGVMETAAPVKATPASAPVLRRSAPTPKAHPAPASPRRPSSAKPASRKSAPRVQKKRSGK
ncbi:MAG: transglycosylase SLT domain-containing protein [Vicinamibacterales bacterium]